MSDETADELASPQGQKRTTSGLLGKIEKTVSQTKQRAQNVLSSVVGQPTGERPPIIETLPQPSAAAVRDYEEKQMQWALKASLEEERKEKSGFTIDEVAATAVEVKADSSAGSSSSAMPIVSPEAMELQAAAARVSQCLQDAEARAAAADELNSQLRQQIKETKMTASGLSDQLQSVEAKVEKIEKRCRELQEVYSATQASSPEENRGVVTQLFECISQLENELLRATHFAQPDDNAKDTATDEARAITEEARPAVEVTLVSDAPKATQDVEPITTLNEVSEDATAVVEVVVSASDAPESAALVEPVISGSDAPEPAVVIEPVVPVSDAPEVAAVVESVPTAGDAPGTVVVVELESAEDIEKVTEQEAVVEGSPEAEKDFLQ